MIVSCVSHTPSINLGEGNKKAKEKLRYGHLFRFGEMSWTKNSSVLSSVCAYGYLPIYPNDAGSFQAMR